MAGRKKARLEGVESVVVSVPGSTSNLGSGFDTLGIALSIRNSLTVSRDGDSEPASGGSRNGMARIISPIPESVRPGAEEMLSGVCEVFRVKTGINPDPVTVAVAGDVPVARGLGSSVTLRIGLVAALARLHGLQLSSSEIGEWVSEIEGHPDNAMPSALGGFCVAGTGSDGKLEYVRFELPGDYRFITLIPDFEVRTDEARKSLPDGYSRDSAVKALNRSSMVTGLLATGQLNKLSGFFDDPIHQPYRGKLIPGFERCMEAGREAGACGGWISGSGSTLMWLAQDNYQAIGDHIHRQMPSAELHFLTVDNKGLTILEQNQGTTTPIN